MDVLYFFFHLIRVTNNLYISIIPQIRAFVQSPTLPAHPLYFPQQFIVLYSL